MNEENEFYFESDHLALKQNKDYHALLKTIAVLESQRIRAVKDIDTIKLIEKEALSDPDTFVEKIKTYQNIGLPPPQIIADIPKIDWTQYSEYLPHDIRQSVEDNCSEELFSENSSYNSQQIVTKQENSIISAHLSDESKSQTSNRLWSLDEQKRLEELLIEYPPEPIEMRRFEKIAKALGNRTTKQVCSRVQKYFIKLRRAGLPIPGRIPKTVDRKSSQHRHQRNNKYLYRPSTFFPNLELPVFMSDYDDYAPGPSNPTYTVKTEDSFIEQHVDESSDDDTMKIKEKVTVSDTYQKLDLMRRVMKEKRKENSYSYCAHLGYKCDFCGDEPIVGTRWHCENCTEVDVDFCTDCVIMQLDSDKCHPIEHRLIALRVANNDNQSELSQRNFLIANSSGRCVSKGVNKDVSQDHTKHSTDPYSLMKFNDVVVKTEISETSNLYDTDYLPESFVHSAEGSFYNYLDPNFLPQ